MRIRSVNRWMRSNCWHHLQRSTQSMDFFPDWLRRPRLLVRSKEKKKKELLFLVVGHPLPLVAAALLLSRNSARLPLSLCALVSPRARCLLPSHPRTSPTDRWTRRATAQPHSGEGVMGPRRMCSGKAAPPPPPPLRARSPGSRPRTPPPPPSSASTRSPLSSPSWSSKRQQQALSMSSSTATHHPAHAGEEGADARPR